MTTLALRDEFRKDPALPILLGDEVFVRAIRKGVEEGVYVYQSGTLLFGPGDPTADIRIDENSVVFTMDFAPHKSGRAETDPRNAGSEAEAAQPVAGV